jgi:superfamily II DNA or RNA helicase
MTHPTRLQELNLLQAYSTGTSDLMSEFYIPCLSTAIRYDRAVGFFRSSVFVVASLALSSFVQRGGRMRLICSPRFSQDDIASIERGLSWREVADARIQAEVTSLLEHPESVAGPRFLATLIAGGYLELRVAIRPASNGIFHDKLGMFSDVAMDTVSFVGSANETLAAWDPRVNHEGFEVFASWRGPDEAARVARHRSFFDDLWQGTHAGVTTLQIPEAARRSLLQVQEPDGLEAAAWAVRRALGLDSPPPSGPQNPRAGARPRKVLQEHQRTAVESWTRAGNRGIVSHVTGAGKTITALEIVRQWIAQGDPALILVPSELLLHQWRSEIAAAFDEGTAEVLVAGGGAGRATWEGALTDFTRPLRGLGPRITLSTMQTAVRDHFISRVQQGRHLLIVADEVHRLGAEGYGPLIDLHGGAALGLSATPKRFGDPSGTAAIYAAFGDQLEPKITIGDAIRLGRLVPYDYFVHRVALADAEMAQWAQLSDELRRVYAALPRDEAGRRIESHRYQILLFERARVIKQATAKVPLAASVLEREYCHGDRWLIYCDDTDQLGKVVQAIRLHEIPVYEYFSAMDGSREATMAAFATHGGVLVAIRCLDEGVDLPMVNKALILASSANPREFIQRRGRVLRTAPNKLSASIHDTMVLPPTVAGGHPDSIPSFAITDLSRATDFAKDARNSAVLTQLRLWAAEIGLASSDLDIDAYEHGEDQHARE